MKPWWIRPSYFAWLVVPAALFVVYQTHGLPHLIWWRTWLDEGRSYHPAVTRTYIRCTYVGPYGPNTIPATDGSCTWIVFFHDPGVRDD